MMGNGTMMVIPPWLRPITSAKLHSSCKTHRSEDRKFYCTVCMAAFCEECKKQHDLPKHEMIKAYKVGRDLAFRMGDLESLWDISDICPYTSNKCLVAYICKRGAGIASSGGKMSIAECESCRYQLKSLDAKYCSLECKVEAVMKMNESGSTKNEEKRKVETISEESLSNVKSFRKRPRKQKNPRRAPFY